MSGAVPQGGRDRTHPEMRDLGRRSRTGGVVASQQVGRRSYFPGPGELILTIRVSPHLRTVPVIAGQSPLGDLASPREPINVREKRFATNFGQSGIRQNVPKTLGDWDEIDAGLYEAQVDLANSGPREVAPEEVVHAAPNHPWLVFPFRSWFGQHMCVFEPCHEVPGRKNPPAGLCDLFVFFPFRSQSSTLIEGCRPGSSPHKRLQA